MGNACSADMQDVVRQATTVCCGVSVALAGYLVLALALLPQLRRRMASRLVLALSGSWRMSARASSSLLLTPRPPRSPCPRPFTVSQLGTALAGVVNSTRNCPFGWKVAGSFFVIATMLWTVVIAVDVALLLRSNRRTNAQAATAAAEATRRGAPSGAFAMPERPRSRISLERLYHAIVWVASAALAVPLDEQMWELDQQGGDVPATQQGAACALDVVRYAALPIAYNSLISVALALIVGVVVSVVRRPSGALDWRQRERARVMARLLISFLLVWTPFYACNYLRIYGAEVPCSLQLVSTMLFGLQGLFLFGLFGLMPPYCICQLAAVAMARALARTLATCAGDMRGRVPSEVRRDYAGSADQAEGAAEAVFFANFGSAMAGSGGSFASERRRKAPKEAGVLRSEDNSSVALLRDESLDLLGARVTADLRIDPTLVVLESDQPFSAGGQGMVFAATYGSERVCVKQVFVTVMDPLAVGDFRREVKMLAQLRHPHIVHLFGICELQNRGLAIVMEMCGGSLQDLIKPRGVAGHPAACPHFLKVARQLCSTMSFVHAQAICHRDLKPDNVLVADSAEEGRALDFDIRICDWGTARLRADCCSTNDFGTPHFTPPEIMSVDRGGEGAYDGRKWDVYSMSVLLWFCWTGAIPFDGLVHAPAVFDAVQRGERPPLGDVPPRLARLLRRMWDPRAWLRPSMALCYDALRDRSIIDWPADEGGGSPGSRTPCYRAPSPTSLSVPSRTSSSALSLSKRSFGSIPNSRLADLTGGSSLDEAPPGVGDRPAQRTRSTSVS
jgi:serine/threonine protein kinase